MLYIIYVQNKIHIKAIKIISRYHKYGLKIFSRMEHGKQTYHLPFSILVPKTLIRYTNKLN